MIKLWKKLVNLARTWFIFDEMWAHGMMLKKAQNAEKTFEEQIAELHVTLADLDKLPRSREVSNLEAKIVRALSCSEDELIKAQMKIAIYKNMLCK